MARRELISGPNFSGRSGALMTLLHDGSFAPESFYIGPYSEAALSGGEQVLLALHCFSLSGYRALAIDTALEQLDKANRDAALDYLDPRRRSVDSVALIDNRLPPPLAGWKCHERAADTA